MDVDQFPLKSEVSFSLNPVVSENFVLDQLHQLRPNHDIGLDRVSSRLLKDSADLPVSGMEGLYHYQVNSCVSTLY